MTFTAQKYPNPMHPIAPIMTHLWRGYFDAVSSLAAQAARSRDAMIPDSMGEAAKSHGTPAVAILAIPFDVARQQYVAATRAGIIELSMISNTKFEKALGALEDFALGPLSRRA